VEGDAFDRARQAFKQVAILKGAVDSSTAGHVRVGNRSRMIIVLIRQDKEFKSMIVGVEIVSVS
jgi:hypothetical protein